MTDSFNGYHVWLGIPPSEQPPNHYRLLGIGIFETDLDVIDHAADRQMAHVRTFQAGRHKGLSQQILNELAAARVCLLNADRKKAYDDSLRERLAAAPRVAAVPVGKAVPVAPTVVAAAPKAEPVPEATPIDSDEDDAYGVEEIDPDLLARRPASTFAEDVAPAPVRGTALDGHVSAAPAPSIQLGPVRRPIDRDASLQRMMIYIFGAVAVIVVLMVLYGMLQRRVAPKGWKELFTAPPPQVESEVDPAPKTKAPPPPAPIQSLEN